MGEVCWCVIMCDLLAGCSCFCAPGRFAVWVCLGVFPTWYSKAGADTGSICNRTSFNGHVFYFKLWVLFMWVEPWFYSLLTKTFFPVVWLYKIGYSSRTCILTTQRGWLTLRFWIRWFNVSIIQSVWELLEDKVALGHTRCSLNNSDFPC